MTRDPTNVEIATNSSKVVEYGEAAAHDSFTVARNYEHENFNYIYDEQKSESKNDYEDCRSLRRDLTDFINCMLKKARYNWKYLIGKSNKFGGFKRTIYEEHQYVHEVRPLDRTRIVALLEGCLDDNKYLDYWNSNELFKKNKDPELFINEVKLNLKHQLIYPPNKHFPTGVFKINDKGQGLNKFFSELLIWDTKHCYGTFFKLFAYRDHPQSENLLNEAAIKWIDEARETSAIYRRYPNLEKADELDNSDLQFE